MGAVWRATDEKLGREVALKVLPDALADDPERRARIEREAKVLASLNHPNIATLYGLEEVDGQHMLVMELVEGEDLAARINRGPLAVEEALPIALQMAEGLEAAHERGVIHRDLKPANVMVGRDGTVKVLDFGLATAWEPGGANTDLSRSPTVTAHMTQAGVILGTAAYMSPEQARGLPLDRRTDIWSFGVVLYEMLSGESCFGGQTVTDILAAIVKEPPDWTKIPQPLPWGLQKLLERTLEKDPYRRLRDVGEARLAIEGVVSGEDGSFSEPVDGPTGGLGGRRTPWVLLAAAVVVGALSASAVFHWGFRRAPIPGPTRLAASISLPEELPYYTQGGRPALSPDGSALAYTARLVDGVTALCVRNLASGEIQQLDDTLHALSPFWSPDSSRLGFYADGKLKVVQISTGLIEVIADAAFDGGATWNHDGTIVFSGGWYHPLQSVPSSGGQIKEVSSFAAGDAGHHIPHFLPDGHHFLFAARELGGETQVRVGSLDGGEGMLLFDSHSAALYAQPGVLVWWQDGVLRGQKFDAETLELTGEVFRVASNVSLDPGWAAPLVSFADTGMMVYQPGSGSLPFQMTWFDRSGHELGTLGPADNLYQPNLSPDGKLVALDISNEANSGDIFLLDVADGTATQFTFDSGDDSAPVWSPDSSKIVFMTSRNGTRDLWQRGVHGGAEATQFFADERYIWPTDWSNDGRELLCTIRDTLDAPQSVWVYTIADGTFSPVAATRHDEWDGCFSPDGRWIAYTTSESGRAEVYVKSNPPTDERWRVSNEGGRMPNWAVEGELFFATPDGTIMSVEVETDPRFSAGQPRALFSTTIKDHRYRQFNATVDGQRFLVNRAIEFKDKEPLALRLGWADPR